MSKRQERPYNNNETEELSANNFTYKMLGIKGIPGIQNKLTISK